MARSSTARADTHAEGVSYRAIVRPFLRVVWAADSPDAPAVLEPGAPPDVVAFHRGYMCLSAGEFEKAVDLFYEVLRIKPKFAEAYYNLGLALSGNSQFPEAVAAFREAVRAKRNWAEALHNLGVALADNSQFLEARVAFREAVRINPDDAASQYNLGVMLAQMWQFPEAAVAYSEAVRIKPDWAEAQYNLGVVLHHTWRFLEAWVAFGEAARIKPDWVEAREAYNRLQVELGDDVDKIIASAIDNLTNELTTNGDAAHQENTHVTEQEIQVGESNIPEYNPNLMNEETVEFYAFAADALKRGLSTGELKQAIEDKLAAKAQAAAGETTKRAKAKPRAKLNARDLSGSQVVAVIEDSTLGRLHRRYTELLATVALPPDGLKSVEQARAAGRLSMTFDNLQARREKLGLEPLPKDDRVAEARRLNVAFYRGRKAQLAKAAP